MFRLSPDGRHLVVVVNEVGRSSRLWIRRLDLLDTQPIPGTDGADIPFWSPDSAFIGFAADGKLKKVAVEGGPAQTLCEVSGTGLARGTWGADGVIVFAPGGGIGLMRVPAAGGVPVAVTKVAGGRESHQSPIPDRRTAFPVHGYRRETRDQRHSCRRGGGNVPDSSAFLGIEHSVRSGQGRGGSGHLLFGRDNTLLAQPFDADRLRMTGESFPVAEDVGTFGPGGRIARAFSASENGVLAYSAGTQGTGAGELFWVDQTGKQMESAGPPGVYGNVQLAPDDKKIAFDRRQDQPVSDIWVLDLVRGASTRLTFDPAVDNLPIWSPDGLRVVFASRRGGAFNLYVKAVDWRGPGSTPDHDGHFQRLGHRLVAGWPFHPLSEAGYPDGTGSVDRSAVGRPGALSLSAIAVRRRGRPVLSRRALDRVRVERVGPRGSLRAGVSTLQRETADLHQRWLRSELAEGRHGVVLSGGRSNPDGGRGQARVERRSSQVSRSRCSRCRAP